MGHTRPKIQKSNETDEEFVRRCLRGIGWTFAMLMACTAAFIVFLIFNLLLLFS